jgi:Phenazine biosynthesis-like protein
MILRRHRNSSFYFGKCAARNDDEMQAIARETKLQETAFVLPRDTAIEREPGIREAASVREKRQAHCLQDGAT